MTDKSGNKNKRKNNRQDVITVLAALAIIILSAVVCGLIQRNPGAFSIVAEGSAGNTKEQQEAEFIVRAIIMCLSVVSIIIIGLFVRGIVKKKRLEAERQRQQEEKRRQLEEARIRVERARRGSYNDNSSQLKHKRDIYGNSAYSDEPENDEWTYEKEYDKYSIDDDKIYDEEKKVIFKKEARTGFFERIKEMLKKLFSGKEKE